MAMPMTSRMSPGSPARAPLMLAFLKDESASTALEFGLVGLPFLIMLFAIIETTTVYFASSTLENGTLEVARRIRTGQVQANEITETQFKNELCGHIAPLLHCDARLNVDVRTFDDFNDVDFIPAIDADGNLNMAFQFNPGAAGDVVLVRAFYVWDIVTPIMGHSLSNMAGGHRLLAASAAFRNEPFGDQNALN